VTPSCDGAGDAVPRLRVWHVVAAVDDSGHGVAEAVRRLAAGEQAAGADVEVLAARPASHVPGVTARGHLSDRLPHPALMRSPGMRAALMRSVSKDDLIHAHNLWTMPMVYAAEAAGRAGCPLVCSTHGALDPCSLQVSRAKKLAAWWLWQRRTLACVDLFHATSPDEADQIRRQGLRAPVAIIPHGVDVPATPPPRASGRRCLAFLGRLHPIKGVDRLLRAWGGISQVRPDWQLRICGPDGGAARELRALAASMPRVVFQPGIKAEERSPWFSECDLLVLPSHGENFGMVVVESLAHGVPVIASTGTPWRGLVEHGCGWWVANDVATLQETILAATSGEPTRLRDMGLCGREWMIRDFSWPTVAERMLAAYRWLLGTAARPPDIVTT
jgi:glycosyltransferase involved in cell wall biosynthesis